MKTSKSILSPADGRDAETQIFKSKATARKKQEARRSPARKEGPGLTTWILGVERCRRGAASCQKKWSAGQA